MVVLWMLLQSVEIKNLYLLIKKVCTCNQSEGGKDFFSGSVCPCASFFFIINMFFLVLYNLLMNYCGVSWIQMTLPWFSFQHFSLYISVCKISPYCQRLVLALPLVFDYFRTRCLILIMIKIYESLFLMSLECGLSGEAPCMWFGK